MRNNILKVTGIMLLALYASLAVISILGDTCTGGGESNIPSIILGIPFYSGAAYVFLKINKGSGLGLIVKSFTLLLLFGVLIVWGPLFYTSTIQGHHACGANYDDFLQYNSIYERYVPLVHILICIVLSTIILRTPNKALQPTAESGG